MPMRLSTSLPIATMAFRHWHTDDREAEIVLAKARFVPRGDGRFRADQEAPELRLVDEFAPGDAAMAELKHEQEIFPTKPATDILVRGIARAPGGKARPHWDVSVEVVDHLRHAFQVRGPSEWRKGMMGWRMSSPEPVKEVPLRYALAYGGHGPGPDPKGPPRAFEMNPAGLGYATEAMLDAGDPVPAPQIGLLGDYMAVRAPGEPMTVCGTMPIAKAWMPRRAEAGTFDDEWEETRHPRMPRDYGLGFWNCAPHQLRADPPLTGDELVRLGGMSGTRHPLEMRLPGVGLVVDAVAGTPEEDEAELTAELLSARGIDAPEAARPDSPPPERLRMQVATVELDVQSADPANHSISVVWCLLVEDPARFRKGEVKAVRLNPREQEQAA